MQAVSAINEVGTEVEMGNKRGCGGEEKPLHVCDGEVRRVFLRAPVEDGARDLAVRDPVVGALAAVEAGLRRYSACPGIVPARTFCTTPAGQVTHLYMPVVDDEYCGVKHLCQGKKGGFRGSVVVSDGASGAIRGTVAAGEATAVRTALASCVGLWRGRKVFLKGRVVRAAIFGTGLQAFWHAVVFVRLAVAAESEGLEVKIAFFYRKRPAAASEISELEKCTSAANVSVEQVQWDRSEVVAEILGASDVVFGCAPTEQPLIHLEALQRPRKPQRSAGVVYVSLIGSYRPEMHECDSDTVRLFQRLECPIIVDSKEHCLSEAGELISNNVTPDQLIEIGQLGYDIPQALTVNGTLVTLCKIVGLAIMDVAFADYILSRQDML